MTINYPGPYEVRLFYSVNGGTGLITHQARYNVKISGTPTPGDPFSGISVVRRDLSTFSLQAEVDAWVTLIKGLWNSTAGIATIDYAELWKYDVGTFDASFVSTYAIAVAGTSASAVVSAQQCILTFRTTLGGIMKLNFMETIITTVAIDTPPLVNATLQAIQVAVAAGTSPWLGRDGGYPFACIAMYPGQNEALFKRRNR